MDRLKVAEFQHFSNLLLYYYDVLGYCWIYYYDIVVLSSMQNLFLFAEKVYEQQLDEKKNFLRDLRSLE